ncbi:Apoptosis-inducing factor 2 [Coemansia sp. RSA 2131]|nr:Apoptosis-inducing factor 2 [Coemansia sp. RSA 2131]
MGQSRNAPIGVSASTRSEYLQAMEKYFGVISDAQSIAIVGGGAVGTELAADLKTDYPDKEIILIHSRELPISGPFMDEFRHEAVRVLHKLGVTTMFGQRVIDESAVQEDFSLEHVKHANILPELIDSVKRNATLVTSTGAKVHADLVFNCLGTKNKAPLIHLPSSSSSDAPVFSSTGIRINNHMQIDDPKYPHIFAVGDISNQAAVAKYAGAAIKSGNVAGSNITKLIRANGERVELGNMGKRRGGGVYSTMKLVLGEHNTVIQSEDGVIPPEMAASMSSPDIKLSKVLKNMAVGKFPTLGR